MPHTLIKTALLTTLLLTAMVSGWSSAAGASSTPFQSLRHQSSSGLERVLAPLMHSQNRQSEFRNRSEVMQEVKRRYDAKVLKISLNKQREVYNVRVLMPSGKVRNIQISARR